jgi:U4/U6 small nuclear ribonucleoprotein PRP4
MAVPTDDKAVRAMLRARGEPVTLFGEREMERRDRLRALLAADGGEAAEVPAADDQPQEVIMEAPPVAELFYTEGGDALLAARLRIAHASLRAAAARLAEERDRAQRGEPPAPHAAGAVIEHAVASLSVESSQFGDERPLSDVAVSPDGGHLLTGSWSGGVAVWSNLTAGCNRTLYVRAHEERVSGVAWHPDVDVTYTQSTTVAFATAGCDKTARLWTADGAPRGSMHAQGARALHPACGVDDPT